MTVIFCSCCLYFFSKNKSSNNIFQKQYGPIFITVNIGVSKQHKINPSVMRTYPNHHIKRHELLNHDSLIKTKLMVGFLEEETTEKKPQRDVGCLWKTPLFPCCKIGSKAMHCLMVRCTTLIPKLQTLGRVQKPSVQIPQTKTGRRQKYFNSYTWLRRTLALGT